VIGTAIVHMMRPDVFCVGRRAPWKGPTALLRSDESRVCIFGGAQDHNQSSVPGGKPHAMLVTVIILLRKARD